MPFNEVCIYQVKPQKAEEFEALMLEARDFLESQPGLLSLRLFKRGHRIDLEQIREGLPPPRHHAGGEKRQICALLGI